MHTNTADITPFAAGYRWHEARHHLLYVAVISLVIGSVFGLIYGYWIANLLGSLLTGIAAYSGVVIGRLLVPGPPKRALAAVIVLEAVGAVAGQMLAIQWLGPGLRQAFFHQPGIVVRQLALVAAMNIAIVLLLYLRAHSAAANRAVAAERLKQAESRQQLLAAQLKLLQAQIEPHFLFNTLANVQSLIDSQPAKAQAMLAHLNNYLRATLARTRAGDTTLGEELELLRHYLMILQFRVGERLQFSIECDPQLLQMPLAPMLLQPLVENAFRHGIEPSINGGQIAIGAARDAGQIRMWVADSGLGIQSQTGGSGVGLANVRQRLQTLYGPESSLQLQDNAPHGVVAEIRLPQREAA